LENPYQAPATSPTDPMGPGPSSSRSPDEPAAIVAFGVLNIVYGGVAMLCNSVNSLSYFVPAQPVFADAALNAALASPGYRTGTFAVAVGGMLASAVLIVAGIGLLSRAEWGRKLSLAYGAYNLAAQVAYMALCVVFLLVPVFSQLDQRKKPEDYGQAIGMAIGLAGVALVVMIYPTLVLVFLGRRKVAQALRRGGPAPASGDEILRIE
jgi:hypothetical protein